MDSISVLMPCFNAAATINKSIQSVLSQNLSGTFELIVQDAGSTDGTLEILQSYGDSLSYVSLVDSGQSQALNRALRRAQGNIIGWLNADDLYEPGAFQAVLDTFHNNPNAQAVYGDFQLIDADSRVLRRYHVSAWDRNRFFRRGCYVWSGALFVQKSLFEQVGPYDEHLHYCMDLDMLLRLSAKTSGVPTSSLIGSFRIHQNSKSGGQAKHFVSEGYRVLFNHAGASIQKQVYALINTGGKIAYLSTRRIWLSNEWSQRRREKRL